MEIRKLTGSFGCLSGDTLTPGPGLTIIEAPNESGKSTWSALLRVLFYGLNTRDRSPDADKRRYAPWSGAPMEGALELSCSKGDVTILRRTERAAAPMGSFSAVYTGTAIPAEGIPSMGCGEALLGVSEEVYRRTAFIGQADMAFAPSRALEQRVASILTSGEDDTSYAEAAAVLHRQMNRRRTNKATGDIPRMEAEAEELRQELVRCDRLDEEVSAARQQLLAAEAQQEELRHRQSAEAAEISADAEARLQQLDQQIASTEERLKDLPSTEVLSSLQSDLDTLGSLAMQKAEADDRAEAAARLLSRAEDSAVSSNRKQLPRMILSSAAVSAVITAAAAYFSRNIGVSLAIGGAFLAVAILIFTLLSRRKTAGRREERLADSFHEANLAWQEANRVQKQISTALREQQQRTMAQIHCFCPTADLGSARAAVSGALHLRRELQELILEREQILVDRRLLNTGCISVREDSDRFAANKLEDKCENLRRDLHIAMGRRQAAGSREDIAAKLEALTGKIADAEEEYAALSLASDALAGANARMQTEISPILGKISGKIFAKLTKEKYNTIVLDAALHPSAEETGQLSPVDPMYLSQGAADQLYLAVRLALSETILPKEDPCPLILDDALLTFDDDRCAAALDLLSELSKKRQILLFTCQSRERIYMESVHTGTFHSIKL